MYNAFIHTLVLSPKHSRRLACSTTRLLSTSSPCTLSLVSHPLSQLHEHAQTQLQLRTCLSTSTSDSKRSERASRDSSSLNSPAMGLREGWQRGVRVGRVAEGLVVDFHGHGRGWAGSRTLWETRLADISLRSVFLSARFFLPSMPPTRSHRHIRRRRAPPFPPFPPSLPTNPPSSRYSTAPATKKPARSSR